MANYRNISTGTTQDGDDIQNTYDYVTAYTAEPTYNGSQWESSGNSYYVESNTFVYDPSLISSYPYLVGEDGSADSYMYYYNGSEWEVYQAQLSGSMYVGVYSVITVTADEWARGAGFSYLIADDAVYYRQKDGSSYDFYYCTDKITMQKIQSPNGSVKRATGSVFPSQDDTGNYYFPTRYSSKNVARNVSKLYVGVNGVARKVVKAYVGVDGVARPFWND